MKTKTKLTKFIIFFLLYAAALLTLPQKVHSLTIMEEEKLAKEFIKVISARYEIVKDQSVVDYVENIGKKIIAVMPEQPFDYRFYIVKDDNLNAFAIPAGHIFVHTGLITAMKTEEELAGILAHEICHVYCRHISQAISRASKINLATLAGMVAGILLGAGGNGDMAQAITAGSIAAGQSLSLAFSRENERQADQIGLLYLKNAEYNGSGLLKILKKMRDKSWYGSDIIPAYLTTHPAVEERIAYIDTWLEHDSNENRGKLIEAVAPQPFQKIYARVLALYGNKSEAMQVFKQRLDRNDEDDIAHYGYGLILSRKGNNRDALVHLKKALEKQAFNANLIADIGSVYYMEGKYSEALKALESSISIEAGHVEGLYFLGRTQLALKKYQDAVSAFEKLKKQAPGYEKTLYFLGEAYGRTGNLGQAHYNLGFYYKDVPDLKNAAFHFKKALEKIKDPKLVEEIKKELGLLKKLRKKAEKNQKGPRLSPVMPD